MPVPSLKSWVSASSWRSSVGLIIALGQCDFASARQLLIDNPDFANTLDSVLANKLS